MTLFYHKFYQEKKVQKISNNKKSKTESILLNRKFYSLFVTTTENIDKILTEIDGQILGLLDHTFQHLSGDQFDSVFRLLGYQPLKDLFLLVQFA